jgi:hypothetical protein
LKLAEQPSQSSQPSQAKAANGLRRDDLNDDCEATSGQSSQFGERYDDLGDPPLQSSQQSSRRNTKAPLGNDVRDVRDDSSGASSCDTYEGEL